MQRTPPDSWSAPGSTDQHVEASYLPDMATPQPTVIACDPKGTRHQLISHVVSECGARSRWVNDFLAIQQVDSSCVSTLAIVALGACPSPGDPCLEAIQSLKRKGFKVISYADSTESWSLGTRCLVLLAGSTCLLDSAAL